MNPWDIFNPAAYNPLDPTAFTGAAGADRLSQAAHAFPGGVAALVFLLFWAPVGPGIPAGVLLAIHERMNPGLTFGLYALSDLLGALVCDPFFRLLRHFGRRVKALQWLGHRLMKLAMLGTRPPRAEDIAAGGGRLAPTLFRIGTIGFGADVYTAGMLAGGLPVPRVVGWSAAVAGDLIWFAVLLGTSLAASAVVQNDTARLVVVLIAMMVIPNVAKRIFPALRDPVPAARVASTVENGRTDAAAGALTPQPPLPGTGEGEAGRANGSTFPHATGGVPAPVTGRGAGGEGSRLAPVSAASPSRRKARDRRRRRAGEPVAGASLAPPRTRSSAVRRGQSAP